MSKVYILKVQGWGEDEDAMYNVGAYSTLELARIAEEELIVQAEADGLTDTVTDIDVMTLDA